MWGCRRAPATVAPTGWETTCEPFDSLSRLLDLGFSGDMPDDSLRIYCHDFSVAAGVSGDARQLSRAAYWRGRMAFREGRDADGEREFRKALSGDSTSERGYLRRKIEWFGEDIHDFDRLEWYDFLLRDVEYYRKRNDDVMLYGRYIDIFNLMRDIGYMSQAEKYLALADSAAARAGRYRRYRGVEINRALVLYGLGRSEEAGRLLKRLRVDSALYADPDIPPLLDFNLFMIYNDVARLDSALSGLRRTGHNPFNLLPSVLLYKSVEAFERGDMAESEAFLEESRMKGMGRQGRCDVYLLWLRTRARLDSAAGRHEEAVRSYSCYARAADSVRIALEDNELLNREMLLHVEGVERRHQESARRMERLVWICVTGSILLAVMVGLTVRRLRKARRERSEQLRHTRESEHRRLALQVVTDRRGEAISDTRRHLEELKSASEVTQGDVARVLDTLRRAEMSAPMFDSFRELVDNVRPEFIRNLKERCPKLGESALRVACYTYIGMDTKEIAAAMNVRPESVKQARWRLRKALALPPEVDLREALSEFDRF